MYFNRRKFLIASGTLIFANSSFSGTLKTPWQSVGPFYPDWEPDDLDNNLLNKGIRGGDAEGIKLEFFFPDLIITAPAASPKAQINP